MWVSVTSKMLSLVSSQPSTSNSVEASSSEAGPAQLGFDEELMMRSKNLSSTLHKLHLWEKKLYNEVKVRSMLVPFSFCYYFQFVFFSRI